MTRKKMRNTLKENLGRINNKFSKKGNVKKSHIVLYPILGIILLLFLAVGGFVVYSISSLPEINPSNIVNELSLNSVIVDESGNALEKIRAQENRTIVTLEDTPADLQNAFIAIEDKRFLSHSGLDFRGIAGALLANFKSGEVVRGASTITQQLAKNVYLTNEVKIDRKIKEAYIALKLEKELTKDQILEAYLNSIYLGEGAYGVQEASRTYFGKDVSELNLAECALIAGITKNPSGYPPYLLLNAEDISPESVILGEKTILGQKYFAVFNPNCIPRMQTILDEMKSQGYIDEEQYSSAYSFDIASSIVVREDAESDISSYFSEYLKNKVVSDLVKKKGYSSEDAEKMLYTGGLKIYATVDSEMQSEIEDIYNNLSEYISTGNLSTWKTDNYGNIVSEGESPSVVYYKKSNILDAEENLILTYNEYTVESNGDISIDSPKLDLYSGAIDLNDYFTTKVSGTLFTHELGRLSLSPENFTANDDGSISIKSSFLKEHRDFYTMDESGNLYVSNSYFTNDYDGLIQPQSATVIIDHSNGQIKAIVGGRSDSDSKPSFVNRANMPRQTGSSMKPLGAYLPALDNGFTAATPIDDVPFLNEKGEVWPNNYDFRSRGLVTLRESVEQSINVNAVKVVEEIGIGTSMSYLEKLGIIKADGDDYFVTKKENSEHNDENLSALALGGFSYGVSPVDMTGAYAAIANSGTYLEPVAYTKIESSSGEVLLDNTPESTEVVSEEIAYVMTDVLKSTVSEGLSAAQKARISRNNDSIPVAGKTGTTDQNADIWFCGYTPYYAASVWIGNDSMSVKLNKGSELASELWSTVMKEVHEDLDPADFQKPEDIVTRRICTLSGKLASRYCTADPRGVVKEEIFAKGTEPTESCDQHVYINGRVYFKRTDPYDASAHGGIYPEDYRFELPERYR